MLHLDYRDARPIYAQILDGFREQIRSGVLQPGDKMPSVRELAAQLTINPNTIQRAYRELEGRGYIYSVAGKGSFAAHKMDVDAGRKDELLKLLAETARELRFLGLSEKDIIDHLKGGHEA